LNYLHKMDKYQAALRTASAIYYLGWNSLSLNEELALQNNSEFRERVEEYVERMRNGETIRKPRRSSHIVLDQPSMQYLGILGTLCEQCEHVHVDFLCSFIGQTSHFAICLQGYGITYRCLDIPLNEWEEWKKRPNYQGR
jgi:hypothetical protein